MIASANWNGSLQLRMFRWTGAALFAVALHAGALAFLLYSRDTPDEDIAGSIAIELAPIAAGSPNEIADAPFGPPTPERTAASEATKEVPKQETVETARVEPSPLAPNPELSLPATPPEEKQVEKEKIEHAEHESQASAAALPTAPPRVQENTAAVPAAPAIGLSAAALQAQASWERTLVSHINRYKHYPTAAHTHRIEGQVTVQFTVDRAGSVVATQILHSSGSLLLDDEAMAMLRRAAPLPAPPAQAQGETFAFVLPIRFKVR